MTTPLPRCAYCKHGPATHTGGYGSCHYTGCECRQYVDAAAVARSVARHPSGKGISQ